MSLRDGPFGELRVPLTWTAGLSVLLAAVAAIAFLVVDHRETAQAGVLDPVRRAADGVTRPVSGAVAAPVIWSGNVFSFITSYFDAANENRRLRQEVAELRQVRDMAVALRVTNQRYESLLGLRTEPEIQTVTARSIADARGPFANTRLADAGSSVGIQIGNPVLSDRGLVGRIVGVAPNISRILLLTDIASRTPVMVSRTNARAVLTGDGGPNPRLSYLRSREPLRAGDMIVTSGDGGVFPRGLAVGVAVRAMDGSWRVSLASDAAPVDFVKVLLFHDFSQLLNTEHLTGGQMPTPMTEDPRARAGTGLTYIPPPRVPAAITAPPPQIAPVPMVRPAPPRTSSPALATPPPVAGPAAPRPAAPTIRPSTSSPATAPSAPSDPAPAITRPTPPRPTASRPVPTRPALDRPRPPRPRPTPTPPRAEPPPAPPATSNAPPF